MLYEYCVLFQAGWHASAAFAKALAVMLACSSLGEAAASALAGCSLGEAVASAPVLFYLNSSAGQFCPYPKNSSKLLCWRVRFAFSNSLLCIHINNVCVSVNCKHFPLLLSKSVYLKVCPIACFFCCIIYFQIWMVNRIGVIGTLRLHAILGVCNVVHLGF